MERKFAVIENNKVVNIVIGVENSVLAANPGKYIEYTDGWTLPEGIDGGDFFKEPEPLVLLPQEVPAETPGEQPLKVKDKPPELISGGIFMP